MPRIAKDKTVLVEEKNKKTESKTKKSTSKGKHLATKEETKSTKSPSKKTVSKKVSDKKAEEKAKKEALKAEEKARKQALKLEEKAKKEAIKAEAKAKKEAAKSKKTSKKETETKVTAIEDSKKTSTKTIKANATKEKITKTKTTKRLKAKTPQGAVKIKSSSNDIEVVEYYDLPYRYNQTVVKILAQTPTTLFVYWDISDNDKQEYINKYGEYFFNNTKPVLIVHNITKNYSFELDINDFANSWYIRVADSNCDYQVELGRRPINKYVEISDNYLHITTSNEIVSQNDHILFDRLSHIVYFKNVKNNETIGKEITNFSLLQKIGKFDSEFIKKLYKRLYPDEVFTFDKLDLRNPSSGNPSSTFK